MATVTQAITVEAVPHGTRVRYRFRYTLSNGEVHERRAWVANTVNETDERDRRAVALLDELAEAEAARLLAE